MALVLYSDLNSAVNNVTIRTQTRVAIVISAQYILDAGSTDPTIMNNARGAAQSPDAWIDKFIWYIARNINNLTPTDAEIQTIVDSKRNQILAG